MVTEIFFLIYYQKFLRESALPLLTIIRIRFRLVTLLEQLWSQSTCQPQSTRNIFPNRYFFTVPMSFSLQFLGKIWIDTSHSWTLRCFISITVNMKKKYFLIRQIPKWLFGWRSKENWGVIMIMPYTGEKKWIVIFWSTTLFMIKMYVSCKKRTFHQV